MRVLARTSTRYFTHLKIICFAAWQDFEGSKFGLVFRVLASHQCVAGSMSGLYVDCGLSLLVSYPTPRKVFIRVLRFYTLLSPPLKPVFDLVSFHLIRFPRRPQLEPQARSITRQFNKGHYCHNYYYCSCYHHHHYYDFQNTGVVEQILTHWVDHKEIDH